MACLHMRQAVIHEMPVCKVDTQKCKADLTADTTKNFVINLPALIISTILVAEISFFVLPGPSCSRV